MKSVKFLVLPILIALIFSLWAKSAQASSLSLIPQSQNLKVGEETQVTVKLNTQSEDINALATSLNYPADKLEVQSIVTSTFPVLAQQYVDGSSIKLAQGSYNPLNGVFSVAVITFKAKAVGSANLSFTTDSAAPRFSDSTDSLSLSQSQCTIINITDAVVTQTAAATAPVTPESQTLSFDSLWSLISSWLIS